MTSSAMVEAGARLVGGCCGTTRSSSAAPARRSTRPVPDDARRRGARPRRRRGPGRGVPLPRLPARRAGARSRLRRGWTSCGRGPSALLHPRGAYRVVEVRRRPRPACRRSAGKRASRCARSDQTSRRRARPARPRASCVDALLLDAIGSAAAEAAADALNLALCTVAADAGRYAAPRVSPGYGAWDVSCQRSLLALLPAADARHHAHLGPDDGAPQVGELRGQLRGARSGRAHGRGRRASAAASSGAATGLYRARGRERRRRGRDQTASAALHRRAGRADRRRRAAGPRDGRLLRRERGGARTAARRRRRREGQRVFAGERPVRAALATAPRRFAVFDRDGAPALDLGGDAVHFDPGSAALRILDPGTGRRPPETADLVHLAWVTEACRHIAGQSTGLVAADVPEAMGDRWRLYVALLNSRKPVDHRHLPQGRLRGDAGDARRRARRRGGARRAPAGDLRLLPDPAAQVERPDLPGAHRLRPHRHPGRAGVDAAGRRDRAGDAARDGGAALRREPLRRADPPARPPGRADRLRRLPVGVRHAARHHADGRHRDDDGRRRLRPGRQAPRAADPRLHGALRRQGRRLPGRHGVGARRGARRARRHQHGLRPRDARLRELPEPREAGPRQRGVRHGAAPGARDLPRLGRRGGRAAAAARRVGQPARPPPHPRRTSAPSC